MEEGVCGVVGGVSGGGAIVVVARLLLCWLEIKVVNQFHLTTF